MENERITNDGSGEIEDSIFRGKVGSSSPSRWLPISSSPSPAVAVGLNGGANCIVHPVSKFDTLAGVAIKYGVEVADIKRLNGLVSDLQMFALRTLQIPLPGRHPPSPNLCNDHGTPQWASSSEKTPVTHSHSDLFDSFMSLKSKKVSPAMSSLQGYYGLRQADPKVDSEGFEMAVYQKVGANYLEDGPFSTSSSGIPLSRHRKSKSVTNGFMSDNGGLLNPLLLQEGESNEPDSWTEKMVRRRQKSQTDFTNCTPEKLLKEENSNSSAISAITGKALALRPKSAGRTVLGGVDGEAGGQSPIPIIMVDTNAVNGVRKSSSTSSLQESDNSTLSSIWPTSKWSLKPDFQAFSNAAITRPIFDGLPKPMGRRNKAALD